MQLKTIRINIVSFVNDDYFGLQNCIHGLKRQRNKQLFSATFTSRSESAKNYLSYRKNLLNRGRIRKCSDVSIARKTR